jgi:hypothetical protein
MYCEISKTKLLKKGVASLVSRHQANFIIQESLS